MSRVFSKFAATLLSACSVLMIAMTAFGGFEIRLQPIPQGGWRLHCQSANIGVFAGYKIENVFSGSGGPTRLNLYEYVVGSREDGIIYNSNDRSCKELLSIQTIAPVQINFLRTGGPKAIAENRGGKVELTLKRPDGSTLVEQARCTVELHPMAELFM